MFKRIVARVLLFGLPFSAAYLLNRPAPPAAAEEAPVVCVYPGDRPGELRIRLAEEDCSEGLNISADREPDPARTIPAVQTPPRGFSVDDSPIAIPF
jgi:hypothetical protein